MGMHRLCYSEEVPPKQECCVSFTVVPPKGADKEAYEAFKGRPFSNQEELLARFPTSTYAGYVLAKKVPDYSDPLFHPIPPCEQLRQCRDEGKTFVTFPQKEFEEYFRELDRFMRGGRVPEPLRASLWCFYGDQLVRRGKFPEAEQAFSEAAKGTEPGDPKEKAYWSRAQESLRAFGIGNAKPGNSDPEKPPTPAPTTIAPARGEAAPPPPATPAPATPLGGGSGLK